MEAVFVRELRVGVVGRRVQGLREEVRDHQIGFDQRSVEALGGLREESGHSCLHFCRISTGRLDESGLALSGETQDRGRGARGRRSADRGRQVHERAIGVRHLDPFVAGGQFLLGHEERAAGKRREKGHRRDTKHEGCESVGKRKASRVQGAVLHTDQEGNRGRSRSAYASRVPEKIAAVFRNVERCEARRRISRFMAGNDGAPFPRSRHGQSSPGWRRRSTCSPLGKGRGAPRVRRFLVGVRPT